MGNLNCFKYNEEKHKSQWFDEWQNNSSYQQRYNIINGNYCDQMNDADFPIDNEIAKNCCPNGSFINQNHPLYGANFMDSQHLEKNSHCQMQMEQYYGSDLFNRDLNLPTENLHGNSDVNKTMQDNVQEAFMSDWFVREEAELNCNVQTLQKDERNCAEINEFNYEDVKKKIPMGKDNSNKEIELLDNSSDSDMCSIDCLAKPDFKNGSSMGFTTKKNSKCCYTAYIICNNSVEWDNFLKRSARLMTGLQRQFACIIKFSDKISFHRGNSVRTFQIISSHKGNVIRCKAALPKMVSKMLITSMTCSAEVEEYSKECNRLSRPNLNRKIFKLA